MTGSPVVELNRAVAVAMADGPAAGLALVDALDGRRGARRLPPTCHATRADLLRRLDRRDEAAAAYERAAELVTTAAERRYLEPPARGACAPRREGQSATQPWCGAGVVVVGESLASLGGALGGALGRRPARRGWAAGCRAGTGWRACGSAARCGDGVRERAEQRHARTSPRSPGGGGARSAR